jgi:hypothetical protein
VEEEELERIEAMSRDELARYLVAKGFNLSSLESRAAALLAKAHAYGAEAPSPTAEAPRRKP